MSIELKDRVGGALLNPVEGISPSYQFQSGVYRDADVRLTAITAVEQAIADFVNEAADSSDSVPDQLKKLATDLAKNGRQNIIDIFTQEFNSGLSIDLAAKIAVAVGIAKAEIDSGIDAARWPATYGRTHQ